MLRSRKWGCAAMLLIAALATGFIIIVLGTNPRDNWP
jgi:hypothetical protein